MDRSLKRFAVILFFAGILAALVHPLFAAGGGAIDYTGPSSSGGGGSVNSVSAGDGISVQGTTNPIVSLNGGFQVGGSLFSYYDTLNFVGFTVSRSGDVTTVTNGVSVTGSNISGDGSAASPLTVTGTTSLGIQAGGSAFASGVDTVNYVGQELTRSGSTLTVTNKVSVTGSLTGDGSAGNPITYTAPTAGIGIQAGGSAFASGIDTVNYVNLTELSRSGSVLTVTGKVSATSPVSGDGSSGSPVTIANGALSLAKVANIGALTLLGNGSSSPGQPLDYAVGTGFLFDGTTFELREPIQAGGSTFAHANTLNFVGGTLSRSGSTATFTNNVSTSGDLSGDGTAATPVTYTNPFTTIHAGGSVFASGIRTVNYVGQELTRSADVLTVTNKVSTTGLVTGDGSAGNPITISGSGTTIAVQAGGSAFADAGTLNFVGSELSRSGTVTTVTNKVSVTAPVTGDGSSGSPVAVATDASILNSGGSFTVNALAQQGGADFARFNAINWVGQELTRSGSTLTVTNKVSTSGDITGDGSSGSPVTYTNPGLAIQAGGSAFADGIRTINYVGEQLTRSGNVLTVTSSVSTTGSLTGSGSSGSPIAVGSTAGVTGTAQTSSDGSGTALALANHEHALNLRHQNSDGQAATTGHTIRWPTFLQPTDSSGTTVISLTGVTGSVTGTAQANSNGTGTSYALANHEHLTQMRVQTGGGQNAGLFHTIRFDSNLTVTDAGSGVAEIDASGSGSTNNFELAMFGGQVLWNDSDSVSLTRKLVCRNDADDGWIEVAANTQCTLTAGSAANGSDTDSANTWYYLYAIATDASGTSPALYIADDNVAGGGTLTFPTGYTSGRKRQLPIAFRNDASSNLYRFVSMEGWPDATRVEFTSDQDGASATQVVNDAGNTAATGVDISTFVPPISNVAIIRLAPKQREVFVFNSTPGGYYNRRTASNGNNTGSTNEVHVFLNSSKTLIYQQTDGTGAADIDVTGFIVTEVP